MLKWIVAPGFFIEDSIYNDNDKLFTAQIFNQHSDINNEIC